jgi:hypothetical protein
MTKKKHIDHYFQERFKNFEANPAEETWTNIEARLDEKKKRRIIPFWWKFSGVAAVLLIGLYSSKSSFTAVEGTKNPVVIESNSQKTSKNLNSFKTNNATSTRTLDVQPTNDQNKTIVNSNKTGKEIEKTLQNNTAITKEKNNTLVNNTRPNKEKSAQTLLIQSKDNWLSTKSEKRGYAESKTSKIKHAKQFHSTLNSNASQPVALNPTKVSTNPTEMPSTNLVKDNIPPINDSKTSIGINTDVSTDLSTNQKIVVQETTLNDTTKIKGVATNPLEELLSEKESKTKQQSKENSWQISSNVAPVFLGSVTNGSPIDPMFKNNAKTFNTSMSMGIGVSYALNDKFTVRTGINKMSFNYDTKGIAFYADLQENGMANISPTASGKEITVVNTATETDNLLPFENSFVHLNEGYINQKLGYYEVPLEITYALVNKRFGLKVIGGVSTFFLNENSISVVSQNISTTLGKANNLNDMHFSTNLGLGLKYGFMKSFEFNVEPTIKYQLNTFQSSAGNFKPYVIGLYSGVSYKF